MSDILKRLGDRIRFLRKEKGLSQERLGELADLHTNYIGQVERGEKNSTIESLERITIGLNVSLEDLFRYIDPVKQEDELGQINQLLSSRSAQDRAMILKLINNVFDWEVLKYK